MPKINVKGQTVQTGECPQQTDTHAHIRTNGRTNTRTLPNELSPLLVCYAVDNKDTAYRSMAMETTLKLIDRLHATR